MARQSDEARNADVIECLRLVRVAIGDVQLRELPKREVRALTEVELMQLKGVADSL